MIILTGLGECQGACLLFYCKNIKIYLWILVFVKTSLNVCFCKNVPEYFFFFFVSTSFLSTYLTGRVSRNMVWCLAYSEIFTPPQCNKRHSMMIMMTATTAMMLVMMMASSLIFTLIHTQLQCQCVTRPKNQNKRWNITKIRKGGAKRNILFGESVMFLWCFPKPRSADPRFPKFQQCQNVLQVSKN